MIGATLRPVMRRVSTSTLTAAAQTIELTHTYQAGKKYIIFLNVEGGANADVSLYANADTTATNYYSQHQRGDGANATAARANTAVMHRIVINETTFGHFIVMKDKDNAINCIANNIYGAAANIQSYLYNIKSTTTFATLTKLTLSGSAANCFGIGTRVDLYELD